MNNIIVFFELLGKYQRLKHELKCGFAKYCVELDVYYAEKRKEIDG